MPDIQPDAAIGPEHMTELEQSGRRRAHGLNRHVCVDIGPFAGREESFLTKSTLTAADREGEADNPIVFANDSFLTLSGFDRAELLGQSFNSLFARGDDSDAIEKVNAAFENSSNTDPEIQFRRKDGSEFWASIFISPVRDKDDELVQHFVSFVDLTTHKQEQAQPRMLVDELNHRVKNTLATVQSIGVFVISYG